MFDRFNTTMAAAGIAAAAWAGGAAAQPDAAAAQPPAARAEGQMVARDPESGQLRAPTAEEAAELTQQKASAARSERNVQRPQTKYHPSGAVGVRLTDEFVDYLVVVRRPDGSVDTRHVHGRGAAEAATLEAVPASPSSNLPRE